MKHAPGKRQAQQANGKLKLMRKQGEEQTMDRERLAEAIRLREMGRAKQDEAMLGEARALLLDLLAAHPDEAEITYQVALVHDNLGLKREAIPFFLQTLKQGLAGHDTASNLMKRERAFLGLGNTYHELREYERAEETLRRVERVSPESSASGLPCDHALQYAAVPRSVGTC